MIDIKWTVFVIDDVVSDERTDNPTENYAKYVNFSCGMARNHRDDNSWVQCPWFVVQMSPHPASLTRPWNVDYGIHACRVICCLVYLYFLLTRIPYALKTIEDDVDLRKLFCIWNCVAYCYVAGLVEFIGEFVRVVQLLNTVNVFAVTWLECDDQKNVEQHQNYSSHNKYRSRWNISKFMVAGDDMNNSIWATRGVFMTILIFLEGQNYDELLFAFL